MTEVKLPKGLSLLRDHPEGMPSMEAMGKAQILTIAQAEYYMNARARMPVKRKPRPQYSEKALARHADMTAEEVQARIKAVGVPLMTFAKLAGIEPSTLYRWFKPPRAHCKTYKPHP